MAPDLEAVFRSEALDRSRAKGIERESRETGPAPVRAATGWFRRQAELYTSAAHEALAADADSDALTWSLTEEGRERLAQLVEWIEDRLPEELTFETRWVGDEVPFEKLVSRGELPAIIRRGRLEQRTRYRIRPAARCR